MGAWGVNLYSEDFALDLKAMIGAVCRLPFESDQLVELIMSQEPVSSEPKDESYTTFWLVLADQLHKRGIDAPKVRAKALAMIDEGTDLAMMKSLGMVAADLRKREKVLQALRAQIAIAPALKARNVLKAPQPFLMEVGECFAYPTSKGRQINPYFADKSMDPHWQQDGWGAAVIAARGRTLGWLAWYMPMVVREIFRRPPTLADVLAAGAIAPARPGVCPPSHVKRMELVSIGRVAFRPFVDEFVARERKLVDQIAINNIGIADSFAVDHWQTTLYSAKELFTEETLGRILK